MSGYRDDYKSGAREFWWTLPRAAVALFALIVVGFLIAVAVTPLTIGFGWVSGEANLRSFPHVQETYKIAFDDARGMDANARQACRYKKEGLTDQYNAVADNYQRLQGEYDAYMEDHFRGGVIRPKKLPKPYPELEARMKQLCKS